MTSSMIVIVAYHRLSALTGRCVGWFNFNQYCRYYLMLETTIKISKELRNQLKEELHYGESYNDLIKLIYLGVKNAGFRCYED